MAHSRHLAPEDLRLARDPDHLLVLFRKLAYRVEPELTPLDPANLEFPERAGIGRCFLLTRSGAGRPGGAQGALLGRRGEMGMGRPARADRATVDAIEEHRFARRSLEDLRCGSARATSLSPPASAATATPAFRAPPTGSTPGKRRGAAWPNRRCASSTSSRSPTPSRNSGAPPGWMPPPTPVGCGRITDQRPAILRWRSGQAADRRPLLKETR